MNYEQLQQLIQQIDQSSLREFELKNADIDVRMSKNKEATIKQSVAPALSQESDTVPVQERHSDSSPSVPVPTQTEEKQDSTEIPAEGHAVTSPIVGVIYLSPAPDEPAFKQPGDMVQKGDTLCIVEAMKVMNEIKSDVTGTLIRVLVEDNAAVEYNQPLFSIQTEE